MPTTSRHASRLGGSRVILDLLPQASLCQVERGRRTGERRGTVNFALGVPAERAKQMRSDAAGGAGMSIESVQTYEVAVQIEPTG